jgi:hypothetical protein
MLKQFLHSSFIQSLTSNKHRSQNHTDNSFVTVVFLTRADVDEIRGETKVSEELYFCTVTNKLEVSTKKFATSARVFLTDNHHKLPPYLIIIFYKIISDFLRRPHYHFLKNLSQFTTYGDFFWQRCNAFIFM